MDLKFSYLKIQILLLTMKIFLYWDKLLIGHIFEVQKYVERGLYEYKKVCLNINFLYIHPKASKQPPITVPIITNKPVNQSYCLLIRDQQSEKAWFWGSKYILYEIPDWGARIYQVNGIGWAP